MQFKSLLKIATLLAGTILLAAGTAGAVDDNGWTKSVSDIPLNFSLTNDCNGSEVVRLVGNVHIEDKTRIDPAGTFHLKSVISTAADVLEVGGQIEL
jgi:hypothetical protein